MHLSKDRDTACDIAAVCVCVCVCNTDRDEADDIGAVLLGHSHSLQVSPPAPRKNVRPGRYLPPTYLCT